MRHCEIRRLVLKSWVASSRSFAGCLCEGSVHARDTQNGWSERNARKRNANMHVEGGVTIGTKQYIKSIVGRFVFIGLMNGSFIFLDVCARYVRVWFF